MYRRIADQRCVGAIFINIPLQLGQQQPDPAWFAFIGLADPGTLRVGDFDRINLLNNISFWNLWKDRNLPVEDSVHIGYLILNYNQTHFLRKIGYQAKG